MNKGKMKHLKLEDIIVEDRFREDYGNLEELMESISEKGIIQPISVSSDMRLLAGGRRYAACSRLGLDTIPALIRDHVDDLDAREVELMENIFRKDFTWAERVKLTQEIHRLYEEKDPNWSGRQTARLLDRSKTAVAQDLELAQYVSVIPELGNLKTADDARKTIKKMEEQAITQEMARRQQARVMAPVQAGKVDPEANIKLLIRRADQSYQISDVFEGMAKMRTNGHVNFIECDPPYGIDLTEQKAGRDSVGSTVTGYEEVPVDKYDAFLAQLTKELYRVAAKDAWCIFWFGPSWHTQVHAALTAAGWHVDPIPAIWNKGVGQTLQPQIYLARTYEPFFICRKGSPVLAHPGRANVFNIEPVPPQQKYHPTQRPHILIKTLLATFCVPNSTVFVPFLGSGQTLRTCFTEGMTAHGFDINDQYKAKYLLGVEEDARRVLARNATGGRPTTEGLPSEE